MIDTIFKCDGDNCTAVRGDSNHWLLVGCYQGGLLVMPWSNSEAQKHEIRHACGASCAHKILDRYLESLRKESEYVPSV